jgi:small-conductance mechanosensitive channel
MVDASGEEVPMLDLDEFQSLPIFSNSLVAWLIAAAVAAGVLALLIALRALVRRYHKKFKATERTELLEIPLEVLSRTTLLFFVVFALFAGLRTLTMGPGTASVIRSVITIALFWQTGVWAVAAIAAWLERKRRYSMQSNRAVVGSLGIIGFILNVVIWSLVVLLTLDNVGVNITALVAGLGIGGIAVALALQNILGDLFASLSIALDQPFVVGDFLILGDFMGSVEHIGIKSTRLRSVTGEQVILANADVLKARVRNLGRMPEKRIIARLRVAYETAPAVVAQVPALVEEAVLAGEGARFVSCLLAEIGEYALEFELVYFIANSGDRQIPRTTDAVNRGIVARFAAAGIAFAYPTRRTLA